MTPISRIVNTSRVLSDSDDLLSSNSILIKWQTVTAESRVGSWADSSNQTLIAPGGVLVSWLISLSTQKIMGYILQGLCHLTGSSHHHPCRQIPSPRPTSSTSSNTPLCHLAGSPLRAIALYPSPMGDLSPSHPTRHSLLIFFVSMFQECQIIASTS